MEESSKVLVSELEGLSDEECMQKLALLSKGLSHPARIQILKRLATVRPGAKCICGDIVRMLPLAQSSVSQHLKILKETGWVTDRIEGTSVCYCLREDVIEYYETLVKKAM